MIRALSVGTRNSRSVDRPRSGRELRPRVPRGICTTRTLRPSRLLSAPLFGNNHVFFRGFVGAPGFVAAAPYLALVIRNPPIHTTRIRTTHTHTHTNSLAVILSA